MKRDLVAMMSGSGPFRLPDGLSSETHDGFTAILGRASPLLLMPRNKRKQMLRLVTRQQHLEALMKQGTVLPVLAGTRISQDDVPSLISANAPLFERLGKRFSGLRQFQVTVSWDQASAAAKFGWSNPLQAEQGEARFASQAGTMLAEVALERIDLPKPEGEPLSCVILIRTEDEGLLDGALAKVDGLWSEGLRIRQVGPSPAVSFGSIGLKTVTAAATKAARKELALSQSSTSEDIAAARRTALLKASPDHRETVTRAAEICGAALRAGADAFSLAYTWSEGQAAPTGMTREVA